ncbi:MFS transporter [Salinisphaera sp. Q1T1-3]|uniref:MFS transporter n=1 Tax=Salinisphaera sp. Q1T1-3 TaxID=2321229 RepID=UPI0013140FB9|nr:MFS transporter [Salinisphaera sp. Q1T1-3]
MRPNSVSEARRVAVAAMLGTAIEWYDYFVYGIVAALVFDRLFFPALSPTAGAAAALGSFAVGFIARPAGAVLFGHLGDRIGRRATLVTTIVLIGLSSGAIGLLPSYETIGIAAPILLVVLRLLEGLSVGGEWSGAVLMSVEHAPASSRSLFGAMPQLGSPLGTLMSSGVVALVALMPDEAFVAWGWRLPFLLAFPMTAVALYLRLRLDESPAFKRLAAADGEAGMPLLVAVRAAWGRMLAAVAAALMASGAFYLLTVYLVHYGTRTLGVSQQTMLVATLGSAPVEALGIYIGARLGDRFSPGIAVAGGSLLTLVVAWPLMGLVATGQPWAVIAGISLGVGSVGLAYGPLGTLLADAFPVDVRYTAVAVSYNIAGMLGGLVPSLAVATVAAANGAIVAVTILFAGIMAISAIGALILIRLMRPGTPRHAP